MPLRNLPANEDEGTPNQVWIEPDPYTTGKILGYFGRTSDRDQIKNAILARYGTGIKTTTDPTSGNTREVYTVNDMQERIAAGHVEVVSSGFGHNLTTAVCTLFTEPGLKFSLTGPGDLTKTIEYFDEFREASQFLDGMVTADRESFQVGCSILWLEFYEGKIRYRTVDPGKIKVCYDALIDSDMGETRPVNYQDLEDATCVIIETGSFDGVNKSYLAIFGRSPDWPAGRYVTYSSNSNGREVPEVGEKGSFDWREPESNQPANPLSWYADQNPEMNVPEYPLAIFYGGHVRRDKLFPVSSSVLEEALEADMTASHLRAVTNDQARGARVLERTIQQASAAPLPRNLYGNVSLEYGQKLTAVDGNASAAEIAWKLLKEGGVASAQGFGVPDFYVSSEDHTLDAASGVALKVRSTPLNRFRSERININRPAVDKVFLIERSFIALFAEDEEAGNLEKCDQSWEPGSLSFPEDAQVQVTNVQTLVSMGVYDTIEAMRVVYELPSEAEAIDKYEALAKRAKQYPPLNAGQQTSEEQNVGGNILNSGGTNPEQGQTVSR